MKAQMNSEPKVQTFDLLRIVLWFDALVFLGAAAFNFGFKIPFGEIELGFPIPVWQAGVGETVIGLTLLAAAVTGRVALAWVAFFLSVFGIAFGLVSPAVQGPARDIHVILVPLAVILFILLLWQSWRTRQPRSGSNVDNARRRPLSVAIVILMLGAAFAFIAASLIHFGFVVTLGPVTLDDPFRGAAIPEAVIAVVLGIGALIVVARVRSAWLFALAACLFSLLLTIFGLTITLGSARTGDVIYHIAVLVVLLLIVALLLLPTARRSLAT